MEASAVPNPAPAGVSGLATARLLRLSPDTHLVTLIRQGRAAAFEAAYNRHHRAILSFCRHMLADAQEAEDAVQQTFLAAYSDLLSSDKPINLRAWLFTIARNRCYSILRARREHPAVELGEAVTEGLATQVQRRQDLRDLILDMQRLPADQRAALVLAELDALSHEQIGAVLGVPKAKVKALVFQARESLTASRAAREIDCAEIRSQLATLRGGSLRRGHIRRHLRECPGCRAFRKQIEHQRRQLALLLPVAPTLALKEAILAATVGGSAGVGLAGGGVIASGALKGALLKGALGVAALAGLGTAGTLVVVHGFESASIPGALRTSHRLSLRPPDALSSPGGGGTINLDRRQSPLPAGSELVQPGGPGAQGVPPVEQLPAAAVLMHSAPKPRSAPWSFPDTPPVVSGGVPIQRPRGPGDTAGGGAYAGGSGQLGSGGQAHQGGRASGIYAGGDGGQGLSSSGGAGVPGSARGRGAGQDAGGSGQDAGNTAGQGSGGATHGRGTGAGGGADHGRHGR